MEQLSKSIYKGLCNILGTRHEMAMRRDVIDVFYEVMNQLSETESWMCSGSQGEGFRLKESDIDIMIWKNFYRVIWELSQSQYYNVHRHVTILADSSDSPPGFTLLWIPSLRASISVLSSCFVLDGRLYISSSEYRENMQTIEIPTASVHGPCSRTNSYGIEHDFAHCFACDFWPPSALSWIDRCHSWPKTHIVHDIVKSGCHLVAVGHSLGYHKDNEWRISFSQAEQKLTYAMSHSQFTTYGLLKIFLNEVINRGLSDESKLLCSYHMKTAIFWVLQQNEMPQYCPENVLQIFWSPSIRPYIINGLCYPGLSMYIDKQNWMVEVEFDRELFQELLPVRQDVPSSLHLYCHVKSLYRIEQLTGFPSTKYQIVMLQNLAAEILQRSAFLLYNQYTSQKLHNLYTRNKNNSLTYISDKISCKMLKLAAKIGCISDMLYLAMYYYQTCRYREALSVIEISKVKLTQPHVMYLSGVEGMSYIESLGGRSYSIKFKQGIANDLILKTKIKYIIEFVIEQQIALRHRESGLHIQPIILLYMLEFLCERHFDIAKAQRALNNLQLLVSGSLYDINVKVYDITVTAISWQILGICQQITGDLHAALYSYQQALRQHPYNCIRTATLIRMIIIIYKIYFN